MQIGKEESQTSWIERFGCSLGKKGDFMSFEEREATQEDYKVVMRLGGKKTRKAKAQVEINLASPVRNNKKSFYNTSP